MHPLCQLTGRRAVHPLLLRLGDRVAELKAQVEASTAEVSALATQVASTAQVAFTAHVANNAETLGTGAGQAVE